MIRVRDLGFVYNDDDKNKITALRGIDLEVGESVYVAIIGPNGCGKTTLARCLNGLLTPTTGQVLVDDFDVADPDSWWEVRRRVGMVFQNPDNQIVSATVEREIAFGLENLGLPPAVIRNRVEGTLRRFDLHPYRHHPPHRLSGGEKQRLAIASVMAMEPRYLVLDEPTSLLDPRGRRDLITLLKQIHSEGKTTILHITQFPEEALEADRLLVLVGGRIVIDGDPVSILDQSKELHRWGLEAPLSFQLNEELRKSGLSLPSDILLESAVLMEGGPTENPIPGAGAFGHNVRPEDRLASDHLSHVYDNGLPTQQTALSDVSLGIKRGECVALIGPTGSGKTTLAEHFLGLLKPSSGRVLVNGNELWQGKKRTHEVCRKVGLVFQFPELQFFEESVEKEVAFGPCNLGLEKAETKERVRDALELVGLDPKIFGSRSPLSLSAGEQRLVAIATILSMRPEILILDEPTAGLDPGGMKRIFELVRRLHAAGVTVLLISHYIDLIAQVAQRVVVLNEGRVVLQGSPQHVFRQNGLLTSIGLDIPGLAKIMRALRQRGWEVKTDLFALREAKEEILAHLPSPKPSEQTE
ncbi:MAG: ABC transporter ATP-binding protein [bacterium]